MKKLIAIMMALVLMVAMTACMDDGGSQLQKPSDVSTVGDETGSTAGDETGSTAGTEGQQTEPPQPQEVTVAETVLLDKDGMKITATGLEEGSLFGPELKLLIENGSDKDLTVQVRDCSVNGYMVEPMMSVDVVAGKKANDSITFLKTELERCGITSIADMEFSFHIFTTDGWDDYMDTDLIQVKTSIADTYEYTFDDGGAKAYEQDGVKIVVKGLDAADSLFGPGVVLFIENRSGKDITVQTRDVSVNGYMVETLFSSDVVNGKCAVDSVTFLSTDLEENQITEITDVELSFHIFDSDSWDDIADTEMLKITF